MPNSFSYPVQTELRLVEDLIRAQADGHHPDLLAALNILLASGGKRIRPAVTLLVGRMLGTPQTRLITLAAAIELLHTATLVHDDLIDESLLRRGNPTLNAAWAPGVTVLAGDFLFACAAMLAADVESLPVMKLFSKTLTIIVSGEISQLFAENRRGARQDYYDRIYAKTASLFETSAWAASIISPVGVDTQESMRRFGCDLGMAFQIVDDILDFVGEPAQMGKPAGSDLRQGILTLPAIYYTEQHPDDPDIAWILQADRSRDNEQLDRLITAIHNSSAIQNAKNEALAFTKSALTHLSCQSPSIEKKALENLAAFNLGRLS